MIAQGGLVACRIPVRDPLVLRVDQPCRALHIADAHRREQLPQRCLHALHVGLIETGADVQLRLRREQGHGDIRSSMSIEQAHGAQRAPDPGKTTTDNQDFLFHWVLLAFGESFDGPMLGEEDCGSYDTKPGNHAKSSAYHSLHRLPARGPA
ncbi:hypothetical protein FQZ97_644040 [compost metagenome]